MRWLLGSGVEEPNAEFEKPFPGRKTFGATFLSECADYTTFKVTGVRKESPAVFVVTRDGKPVTIEFTVTPRFARRELIARNSFTIAKVGRTLQTWAVNRRRRHEPWGISSGRGAARSG